MRAARSLGLCLALAAGTACALPTAGTVPPPRSAPVRDSAVFAPRATAAGAPPAVDSSRIHASPGPADSLSTHLKSRGDSVIVVKHRFNHREQILTGSLIMTCLALMLVAMNNYNPR